MGLQDDFMLLMLRNIPPPRSLVEGLGPSESWGCHTRLGWRPISMSIFNRCHRCAVYTLYLYLHLSLYIYIYIFGLLYVDYIVHRYMYNIHIYIYCTVLLFFLLFPHFHRCTYQCNPIQKDIPCLTGTSTISNLKPSRRTLGAPSGSDWCFCLCFHRI